MGWWLMGGGFHFKAQLRLNVIKLINMFVGKHIPCPEVSTCSVFCGKTPGRQRRIRARRNGKCLDWLFKSQLSQTWPWWTFNYCILLASELSCLLGDAASRQLMFNGLASCIHWSWGHYCCDRSSIIGAFGLGSWQRFAFHAAWFFLYFFNFPI